MKKITLQINHKEYEATDGETILDVTKKNRIHVPTLCHWSLLTP
ncbi:MAG: (2Fe-2S)-binding protein, partial [Candidatus Scalindua rubra]|nr:(2Fe-2S)-binding protein [Candidatus Scalindua rubra]MBZ0109936.1 (2Fe-2S)-binding protein [Candidatus Scalindua rubra]